MKKLFLFVLSLSILGFTGCNEEKKEDNTAQGDAKEKKDDIVAEADLPPAVASAFKAKYPNATAVEWEKAKENDQPTFKAKWKSADAKMKAEFAEDGAFIKEEKD